MKNKKDNIINDDKFIYNLILSKLVESFNHRFSKKDIVTYEQYLEDKKKWGNLPPMNYIYKKYFENIK